MSNQIAKDFLNSRSMVSSGNPDDAWTMVVNDFFSFPTYQGQSKTKGQLIASTTKYEILPPLIRADYTIVDGVSSLNVDVNFLCNASYTFKKDDFTVVPEITFTNDGQFKIIFYVRYNLPENFSTTGNFVTNCISFSLKNIPSSWVDDIQIAEVFIWDIDPETSRGTKTTVKPPVT